MFLQKFPNIDWLRKNVSQNFVNAEDLRGNPLETNGWPNSILNVVCESEERDNIQGPFSLFFNISGSSKVRVDRKWHTISDNLYCISNKGEIYDLHLNDQTETFNIHFGHELFNDVSQLMIKGIQSVTDNVKNDFFTDLLLLSKTDYISDELHQKLSVLSIYQREAGNAYSLDVEYELTADILELLLRNSLNKIKKIENLNTVKPSTRNELFRRVNVAIDFIHDHNGQTIDLDQISRSCGLSKFHFVRTFKEIYGITPTVYNNQLKLKKAINLLSTSQTSLNAIAVDLGFSELSAFTRFIKKRIGKTPSMIRDSN